MIYGLFIFVTYFCTVFIVHMAFRRINVDNRVSKHYVLYTFNNQLQIEWIIRSLIVFHWIQGKPISITIIDEGSSDETLAILHLLSRQYQLDIRSMDDKNPQHQPLSETSIHIRLSQPEDMLKLPQVSSL